MEIAQVQMHKRMMTLLAPAQNQEALIRMEYEKGAISGFKIMTEMVDHHLATLKDLMSKQEIEDEHDFEDVDESDPA